MTKLDIDKMSKDFLSFEQHFQQELQNKEFEQDFLRVCLIDYAQNGDYTAFFKELERVVKLRTTVSQLAKDLDMNRSNLSNILKGKVNPSFDTTMKILRGLGAEIEVKFA